MNSMQNLSLALSFPTATTVQYNYCFLPLMTELVFGVFHKLLYSLKPVVRTYVCSWFAAVLFIIYEQDCALQGFLSVEWTKLLISWTIYTSLGFDR